MNKKYSYVVVIIFLIFCLNVTPVSAQNLKISAQGAVLIDLDSGKILYSKNHTEKRPPASTTKVLTAILAIEKGNLQDIVEISTRAAQTGEASINLVQGEKISLENLLYGALLKSGNDACVAIAEHITPSVEEFVELMNLKAKLLGCYNSNFVNTNGLPAKNHYSSALDLALIAGYALKNPKFKEIVSTPNFTIQWEESSRKKYLKNTNKLLRTFPGTNGVKTGTTNAAGQCLIASVSKNNRNLVAVLLKSNNRFPEASALLNYGLKSFHNVEVCRANNLSIIKEGDKEIEVKTGKNLIITVGNKETLNITNQIEVNKVIFNNDIVKDQIVGYSIYYNNGEILGRIPLLATENTPQANKKSKIIDLKKIWQKIKGD